MPAPYVLDLSASLEANFIKNEVHTASESRMRDYNFIILEYGPFYIDDFKLVLRTSNGDERELVEDVDFEFALQYVAATRTTGKVVYRAIVLLDETLSGILLVNYRTLGEIAMSRAEVLVRLAEMAYNPRTTLFDDMINVPTSFPPTPHYQGFGDFFGMEELVGALVGIRDAIAGTSSEAGASLRDLLDEINAGDFSAYLARAGGELLGPLTLHADPAGPMQPVTLRLLDQRLGQVGNLTNLLNDYVTTLALATKLEEYLKIAGGTLNGNVALAVNPTASNHLVHRAYVENLLGGHTSDGDLHLSALEKALLSGLNVTAAELNTLDGMVGSVIDALNSKLAKSGGSLTGPLILNDDPVSPLGAVTKRKLDELATLVNQLSTNLSARLTNSQITQALNEKFDRAGGALSGPVTLSQDATQPLEPVSLRQLSAAISAVSEQIALISSQVGEIGTGYATREELQAAISELDARLAILP